MPIEVRRDRDTEEGVIEVFRWIDIGIVVLAWAGLLGVLLWIRRRNKQLDRWIKEDERLWKQIIDEAKKK